MHVLNIREQYVNIQCGHINVFIGAANKQPLTLNVPLCLIFLELWCPWYMSDKERNITKIRHPPTSLGAANCGHIPPSEE